MTANELFWSNRLFQLVGQYPIQEWRQRTLANETARRLQQDEKHTFFFQQNNLDGTNDTTPHYTTIADNLTFWAQFLSWTYWDSCKMLIDNKLLPSYKNRNLLVSVRKGAI